MSQNPSVSASCDLFTVKERENADSITEEFILYGYKMLHHQNQNL